MATGSRVALSQLANKRSRLTKARFMRRCFVCNNGADLCGDSRMELMRMFDWLRVAAAKARALFSKRRLDEDFAEELQTHLASLTEENLHKGMSEEEARRAARLRLGGLTQLREAHRELRG